MNRLIAKLDLEDRDWALWLRLKADRAMVTSEVFRRGLLAVLRDQDVIKTRLVYGGGVEARMRMHKNKDRLTPGHVKIEFGCKVKHLKAIYIKNITPHGPSRVMLHYDDLDEDKEKLIVLSADRISDEIYGLFEAADMTLDRLEQEHELNEQNEENNEQS